MKAPRLQWMSLLPLMLLLITMGLAGYWAVERTRELQVQEVTNDILHRIKQHDTAMDKDVLRITSLQLTHYDTLVEAVHSLRALQEQLAKLQEGHYAGAGADLADYVALSERKIRELERLKAASAGLNNTLQYLPTVVAQLLRREGDSALAQRVSVMFSNLLAYNLLPDPASRTRVAKAIGFLRSETSPDNAVLQNIIIHSDANLRARDNVYELLRRFQDIPTADAITQLQLAHSQHFEKQTERSDRLSFVLFIVTALTLGSLAYTMRRLATARANTESAWRQLHDAVESISEGFALFDAQRRLVLWNQPYKRFHPELSQLVNHGVTLDEINAATLAHHVDPPQGNAEIGGARIIRYTTGHTYLISESRTSDGGIACVHVDITERQQMEEKLREMVQAVEQSPASVIITDLKGCIEYVNPKFEEVSGYHAEEVIGQNPRVLKSGETSTEEYAVLWATIAAGQEWHGEFHNRRKDGELYWEAATISGIRDVEGNIVRYLAVKEDISERKHAEEQLRLAAKVFEKTTEAVIVTDAENRIKAVNPGFTQITGYSVQEVIGRNPGLLASGRHDAHFYRKMRESLAATDSWEGEIWNRRKNGEIYPEWLSIAAIRNDEGEIIEYIGVFSDITRRKEAERKIQWQANYDSLTELPNRSLFLDRLSNALNTGQREGWLCALMFIDLDRFKVVNDTLGHTVGDKLLQQVGHRLLESVRSNDTVARLGGDEFTIILQNVAREDNAAEVAAKIIERLSEPFYVDEHEIHIGASIGITFYPRDGEDATTLIRNADLSMYQAKEAGRNRYHFYTQELNARLQSRMDLERDLRHALAHAEFFLEYQPIVSSSADRVVSAEALVRWNHPVHGRREPGSFVPIAEELGLIGPLGEWVLRTACQECAQWTLGVDPPVGVSVNVSSRQFKLGLTPEVISDILDASGLPPHLLTLEITESLLLEETEEALAWLDAIKATGVRLSIDDFGTGYSSLSYLKRFPVDMLKIDKSFISGVAVNPDDASLVEAIVELAENFKLKAVAEGVESQEQLAFLRQKHCDLIQGFYYSRPLTAEALRVLIANGGLGSGQKRQRQELGGA
jgi:diguanylate cyclase (GGDEF)-like protein/PAS domain S-box-containing protein